MALMERRNEPHPAAALLRALNDKVMPGLEEDLWSRLVIAPSGPIKLRLPPSVEAVPRERTGRRVALRKRGVWERASMKVVHWPVDNLQELRMPKLVFVVRGSLGFRLADHVLRCPAGTGIYLPPGAPHTDGSTSHFEALPPEDHACSLLWFTSMISGLNCRMCHAEGEKHFSAIEGEKIFLQNPRLLQLFNFLGEELSDFYDTENDSSQQYEATRQNRLLFPPVFAGLFLSFLRSVIRDITVQKFYLSLEAVPAADSDSALLKSDPIEQVVQYAKTHFAHPLTIDEMSRRFFISRARLTRRFREHTGQSFLEFINACRLEQARGLLAESEWTAAMIGRYVGFRSPAHFHRLFVREQGLSPSAYRRQVRGKK